MAIGEFGGAPAVPAGLLSSTPLYWLYEMGHAALNPARAVADATRLLFKNPFNPFYATSFGKSVAAAAELFERSTRRYGQPGLADFLDAGRRRARAGAHHQRVGTAVLPAAAFRARVRASAAPAAAASADRGTAVRSLCDAAARHRRGLSAQPRRLHHRVARRAHGAAVGGAVRSRRLHRLRDFDAARARRRHPCDRGMPAGGAGASPPSRSWKRTTIRTCRRP